MTDELVTLDHAGVLSESFSPADALRLISSLAERLHDEMEQNTTPIDFRSGNAGVFVGPPSPTLPIICVDGPGRRSP